MESILTASTADAAPTHAGSCRTAAWHGGQQYHVPRKQMNERRCCLLHTIISKPDDILMVFCGCSQAHFMAAFLEHVTIGRFSACQDRLPLLIPTPCELRCPGCCQLDARWGIGAADGAAVAVAMTHPIISERRPRSGLVTLRSPSRVRRGVHQPPLQATCMYDPATFAKFPPASGQNT